MSWTIRVGVTDVGLLEETVPDLRAITQFQFEDSDELNSLTEKVMNTLKLLYLDFQKG